MKRVLNLQTWVPVWPILCILRATLTFLTIHTFSSHEMGRSREFNQISWRKQTFLTELPLKEKKVIH